MKGEGRESLSEEGHMGRNLKKMRRQGDLGGRSSRQREQLVRRILVRWAWWA